MKINYDRIADAVYFKVQNDCVFKTVEVTEKILVDVDSAGNILGIELLDASSQRDFIKDLKRHIKERVPIGGIQNLLINI